MFYFISDDLLLDEPISMASEGRLSYTPFGAGKIQLEASHTAMKIHANRVVFPTRHASPLPTSHTVPQPPHGAEDPAGPR